MPVLLILILASLGIASLFLIGFVWAVRAGQFDDTLTPSMRMLADEPPRSCAQGRGSALSAVAPPQRGADESAPASQLSTPARQ